MASNEIKTFKNVVDTILCVCRDHPQVNMAETGDAWEISTGGNIVYPLCMVVPTSIEALDKQVEYNFNIICMDLVEPGETNEQNVLSSTSGILLDVIARFKRGGRSLLAGGGEYADTKYHYDYTDETSSTYSLEPFTEKFDDNVAGWNMRFSVTMAFDYSVCDWDGAIVTVTDVDADDDATGTITGTDGECDDGPVKFSLCIACNNPNADTSVPGCCTDELHPTLDNQYTQQNYNPLATCDDGTCIPHIFGCMDPAAINYNASVTVDDGSCSY